MTPAAARPLVVPVFIPHSGCPHQCAFCNQHLITGTPDPLPDEQAIRRTLSTYLEYRNNRTTVELAFFGGNFLGLPAEEITRLLVVAGRLKDEGKIHRARCSTRPDTITSQTLDLIRNTPLTCVELGVQSMDDPVLKASRRGHDAACTRIAAQRLTSHGITTGMQIMTGLPGDTPESASATTHAVCDMAPDFVRIYPLVVLRDSPLARWVAQGRYTPPTLDHAVDQVKTMYRIFDAAGIPVIRMGLQASDLLASEDVITAGPWHPAFGHLVYSSLMLDSAVDAVEKFSATRPSGLPGRLVLHVHPRSVSRLLGERRHNMDILSKRFSGTIFSVTQDPLLKTGDIRLEILPAHDI